MLEHTTHNTTLAPNDSHSNMRHVCVGMSVPSSGVVHGHRCQHGHYGIVILDLATQK